MYIFSATSNHHQQQRPQHPQNSQTVRLPPSTNMVENKSSEAVSADIRKQRAVLKKELQRKFERWDKDPHDRTR